MDLYLLRHAIAFERGREWTGRDADRPLTKKGAKKMRRIAEVMKDLNLSFDVILSSPFRRAKETAEIVADAFDCANRMKFSSHLKVGGSPAALVKEIIAHHAKRGSVLLVGHEPYLSGLISVLVSGNESLSITMKKGGLCKLTIESLHYGRCARLDWLIGPAQILGRD